jgi:hypothetical protein
MKIHNFKIYTGYCENQEIAPVLMSHDEGFDTPQEALKSISEVLNKLLKDDGCNCDAKYKQFDYCGNCRKPVIQPEPDLFREWRNIRNGTIDSLSGGVYESFEEAGWMLGSYNYPGLIEVTILRFYSYLEHSSGYYIDGAGFGMRYVEPQEF